jgi:hypothetical protein
MKSVNSLVSLKSQMELGKSKAIEKENIKLKDLIKEGENLNS